jgi:hypothetical protein
MFLFNYVYIDICFLSLNQHPPPNIHRQTAEERADGGINVVCNGKHMLPYAFILVCFLFSFRSLCVTRQVPVQEVSPAWHVLSKKLYAAHLHYVKRAARCRGGRSRSRESSSSSRSFGIDRARANSLQNPVSVREIWENRAWRSFGN